MARLANSALLDRILLPLIGQFESLCFKITPCGVFAVRQRQMPMHNYTLLGLAKRDASAEIQSSLGVSGVDLIAMVVSDSGLANAEPKWWNASPIGCMLIGLQPRGGWQVMLTPALNS